MYLDKIYVLQTGVSLKISTSALQELIANAIGKQKIPELESLHSLSDLCAYLSVVVSEGRPVPFNNFCNLFWRNLDEDDPDGDEWQQLLASDRFYSQLTMLLNKLRIAERSLQQYKGEVPDWYLGSA